MKINSPSYPWLPIFLSPGHHSFWFLEYHGRETLYVSVVLCPQKNFILLFLKVREDLSVLKRTRREVEVEKQITEELLSEELRAVGEVLSVV